jgi:hypothetical protein
VKYFKNTQLAKLYHVSEKSIRNWIEAAKNGKLDLELFDQEGKFYIANVTKNTSVIETLVEKGKKYKNRRGFRVVTPTDEFYNLYDKKQILNIITSLTVHCEIPLQYSYFDGGAFYWDQYAKRLLDEPTSNVLTRTIAMLKGSQEYIDHALASRKKINVVDLGPGNGLPVKELLKRLLDQGKLNRYIAIDDSQAMLDILETNIKQWFGGSVKFEGHVRDFSYERFADLLADDYVSEESEIPANLVLLLGGTANNFRFPDQAFQAINSSMGVNDLLIYTGYLDTPHTRRYFDFYVADVHQKLSARHKLILDYLGIDEDLYDVEQIFNEEKKARSVSFIPKVDISIRFDQANGSRFAELRKDIPILLWRHSHKNALETIGQFDRNGFDFTKAVKSTDDQYLLVISKIKTGVDN